MKGEKERGKEGGKEERGMGGGEGERDVYMGRRGVGVRGRG